MTCTSISYLFCSYFRLLLVGVACVSTRIGKGQTGTVCAQGVCALRGSYYSIRPAPLKYVVCLLYDDKYLSVACRPEIMYTYSGKLSREKTFTNFAVLWLFTKVFSVKFGGMASIGTPKASNSRKFSPQKLYHIVLGKHPWVLTVQTPKIEGGQLHGGGA